ncbi:MULTISPECIES: hypothetical protein [Pseudomonas]|uniref:hypothetical protein n=1 Tax=Pseudomonas TaxID=286 RepID=UPI0010C0F0E6|nr:hypothetical protein [Pseudomonas asiatica]MEE1903802.1 hypothetical protein [Pseudomonas inefficax]
MELLLGTEKKTSERYARGAVKASRPFVWTLETHRYRVAAVQSFTGEGNGGEGGTDQRFWDITACRSGLVSRWSAKRSQGF